MAGAGAIKAGSAFVELFADRTKLDRDLKKAQAQMRAFANGVNSLGKQMLTTGAAITGPLLAAVGVFTKVGDGFDKMSTRTGVSVEALSELGFAARQSGSSVETLERGFQSMAQKLGEGSNKTRQAVAELGLSWEELGRMSPDEKLKALAAALRDVEDQDRRAALANEVFGKAHRELKPLLDSNIDALQQLARERGITISTEAARAAAEFSDELGLLKDILGVVVFSVGGALVPVLTDFVKRAQDAGGSAKQWVQENEELLRTLLQAGLWISATGAGLLVFGKSVMFIVGTVGALRSITMATIVTVKGLHAALLFLAANPVLLTITAATAGVLGLAYAMRRVGEASMNLTTAEQRRLDAGNRSRQVDTDRMKRLEELAAKERLNTKEMDEASGLIETLEVRYGELGLRIDETTGKLSGMANAQRIVNQQMREAAEAELQAAKAAAHRNIDALTARKADREASLFRNPFESSEDFAERIVAEMEKVMAIERQLSQLRRGLAGGVTGADDLSTGGPPSGAGALAVLDEDAAHKADEWRRRAHELTLRNIEDEYTREVALLEDRFQREVELAQGNAEIISAIRDAEFEERIALERRFAEVRRQQEERQADETARSDRDQSRTNEELRLRATMHGRELEEALLDLREKQAIEDARTRGLSLDLVREEFDLRRRMLQEEEQVRETMRALGTFSSNIEQIVGGLISSATSRTEDQISDATRKTAESNEAIKRDVSELVRITREGRRYGP